jgi:drug/metabolite transporter (DMT)-like permease
MEETSQKSAVNYNAFYFCLNVCAYVYRALFAQYLFFLGLSYTTATLAATFSNMTPVFTFVIAVPLRSVS